MLEYVEAIVAEVEADEKIDTRDKAFARLRVLPLDDFGQVMWSMPKLEFPRLSSLLPAMASEQVQKNWTGNSGDPLIIQTAAFVRSVSFNYSQITGQILDDATILDFGCGYGRIARFMYRYVNSDRFYAADPWDESIRLCNEAGLTTNFVSEYLPESLPVGDAKFNLIYAFSVFTHLSERATLAALRTLRRYILAEGVLAITIRPSEYWAVDPNISQDEGHRLMGLHRETGFAFLPHNRPPVDGDITYGDTSMTIEWLSKNCPEWTVRETDRSRRDHMQRYIFLTPN